MKKVIKYLEKQVVEFREVQYGGTYFYGVEPVVVNAVQVMFRYPNYDMNLEKKIIKYCNRYGYEIAFGSHSLHMTWFSVFTREDYEKYILYSKYAEMSSDECNRYIHDCHSRNKKVDNESVKTIMDKYGEIYASKLQMCLCS